MVPRPIRGARKDPGRKARDFGLGRSGAGKGKPRGGGSGTKDASCVSDHLGWVKGHGSWRAVAGHLCWSP